MTDPVHLFGFVVVVELESWFGFVACLVVAAAGQWQPKTSKQLQQQQHSKAAVSSVGRPNSLIHLKQSQMSSSRSSRRSGGSSRSKSPDHLTGDQPGLRRIVQKRLLEDVFDGASGKSCLCNKSLDYRVVYCFWTKPLTISILSN